jgi:prepilin-type N-terminal cleavage/methylation domain-containing protein/prepilin-type processing-associated H-X9-DG protein
MYLQHLVAALNAGARRRACGSRRRTTGMTLVEVLVVIAIIGALVGLLMPAVQMAREAARRGSCGNNLRQQAIGVKLHEGSHRTYPTGGWGPEWVGDSDLGFGPRQPGGWIYNVLPYVEQGPLREIGKGLAEGPKRVAVVKVLQSPLEIFSCPSRRLARLYPYAGANPLKNVDAPAEVAKTDYVINREISSLKSEVIVSEIQLRRGLSNTVLVGEKSVAQSNYEDGQSPGDGLTMYVGDSEDVGRQATGPPTPDASSSSGFGSAHPSGCNVAMGDGAVRFVLFEENLQP